MTDHTAYIADVFKDAVRVPVTELRMGDRVFDTTGGTHELVKVVVSSQFTRTYRDDKTVPDVFANYETITIIPKPTLEV